MSEIKFSFSTDRATNLFFFVSNLSNWHYSCRPWSNRYWIEKTGELSKEEENRLALVKNIFQKHTYGEKYWGKIFLDMEIEDKWKKAENLLSGEDISELKKACGLLKPRFDKIWEEDEQLLIKWKEQLLESTQKYTPNELVEKLNILFQKKPESDFVRVFLFVSGPNNSASGGANVGSGKITLEMSRTPHQFLRPVWMTLWHEAIHMLWERNSKYLGMLREFCDGLNVKRDNFFPDGVSFGEVMKEAIMESMIPHGYVSQKYFGFPSDDYYASTKFTSEINMRNWRIFSGNKLRPVVSEYFEKEKPIDRELLEEVMKCLEEFVTQFGKDKD